jgi:fructosamine-3-kinase
LPPSVEDSRVDTPCSTSPPASLTHGDLWGRQRDRGALVDPAVSYAERELELAYMQLSNTLPAELWAAYTAE